MRQRGVTLPEILVAGTLLLLVVGVAYAVLVLTHRSWILSSGRATPAINCEVALERLRRELLETSSSTVVTLTDPPAVAFATARDEEGRFCTDSEGEPRWQASVVYYVNTSRQVLLRRRLDTSSSSLSSDDLTRACDGSGSLIAYDIEDLQVSCEGDRLTLSVTCQTRALGRANRLELSTVVLARN
ncbi:MAG TPA: prepilin-type N-terminal cleavage/methylation domain-containing protein [Candidatus Nitrosotenuis sp.]|jgi:Tfp pilus assembly protein PilV|nr:prepilin-type N-terminal cleavage/methylation domain-containing protein [Candidatus Nitrosotenuis sp.]